MKKVVVLVLLIASGLFFFLGGDSPAEKQNNLMEEAVAAIEAFNDNGNVEEAVSKLTALADELTKLNAKEHSAEKTDAEVTDKAEELRAKLANASLELEISDNEKAAEVSAALDKFIGQ